MSAVPERSEVEPEYRWDLEAIYASDDEWERAYEAAADRVEELDAYEGRAIESAETLHELLTLRDELLREISTIAAYARMRRDEDTTNQTYQALAARAQSLVADVRSATSFVEPELQALTREEFASFLDDEPALERYDHYVDDVLRLKPHTRSAEVEELLATMSEVTHGTGEVYSMLANADMTFPTVEDPDGDEVEITQSNFTSLLKRPDRDFRRSVYEAYYDEWETVRHTVGAAYANSVKANVRLAQAWHYDTAREAALDGPNVPIEVYDTLLSTVRDELGTLHHHADLKRRVLGVDELRMWDVYMPIADTESPTIEYDEAREHVVEAVAPLGDTYQSRVAEGLDARWVDVYENRGKRSGAYSGGTYDTEPFILMNYQNDVDSMFTLAHELGHSMHSTLTKEHQPFVYSSYVIFVAEVASTVNEALLTHHLLDTVDDPTLRRHVLDEWLERFRSTLYRQAMFADFEHRVHRLEEEGEALTPDRLDGVYGDLKREFYETAVVDERITREWMRIPHFYSAFYVYQYATGISAAVAIADAILTEGEPAAERYLDFLRRGSRGYPLELLQVAGVDMSTAEPIERALAVYGDHLDEVESLL